ncbi:hypothetical protein GCM10025879_02960 [Leuconostoc litchii]|nr:hypothetical protein GCM10025879_02960 [Leuconostoc litchii]
MTTKELLNQFVEQIIMDTDYTDEDFIYLYNQVLGLVGGIDGVFIKDIFLDDFTTLDILDQLIEIAAANDVLSKRQINADMLGAQLMNFFVPRPSIIRKNFWLNYKISPRHATDYFFGISKRSNYIKTREINQNISFPVLTDYGTLQITINLSKPEKDPKKLQLP